MGETLGQEAEHHQGGKEGLHPRVGEGQSGGSLSLHLDRAGDLAKLLFSHSAIMADSLDVQETSVGRKAHYPQGGQVVQPLADAKVPGVVDGGLGAESAALLVILLNAGALIVQVERGGDTLGDHPGPELPRGSLSHPAGKDQLHLVGPSQVQVLADHLLKEDTTG